MKKDVGEGAVSGTVPGDHLLLETSVSLKCQPMGQVPEMRAKRRLRRMNPPKARGSQLLFFEVYSPQHQNSSLNRAHLTCIFSTGHLTACLCIGTQTACLHCPWRAIFSSEIAKKMHKNANNMALPDHEKEPWL